MLVKAVDLQKGQEFRIPGSLTKYTAHDVREFEMAVMVIVDPQNSFISSGFLSLGLAVEVEVI